MGGGEVARYLGTYGSERVSKAVFISSVPPFLLKTADNPEGVGGSVFDGIKEAIAADRPAFLSAFLADFYNVDVLGGKRISNQVVQYSWSVAVGASAKGTLDCVSAWYTGFRKDLPRVDVPTLVILGDAGRIFPLRPRESVRTRRQGKPPGGDRRERGYRLQHRGAFLGHKRTTAARPRARRGRVGQFVTTATSGCSSSPSTGTASCQNRDRLRPC